MNSGTIVGSGRVKFLKPGERYRVFSEHKWEHEWEEEGLIPKKWAVSGEVVVVEPYVPRGEVIEPWTVEEFMEVVDLAQKAIRGPISS